MDQLLAELNRLGIKVRLDGGDLRFTTPPGALTEELRQTLRLHREGIVDLLQSKERSSDVAPAEVEPDPTNRSLPFPLTELQQAYWIGRSSQMEMGNVAPHFYVELDCPALDVGRLNHALRRMIARHDMLRAVVGGDGLQRSLPQVPAYQIAVDDQLSAAPHEVEQAIEATRHVMSHQVMKTDQWPLFEIRVTLLPGARTRLHVSLDALFLDAWSMALFFQEWYQLYERLDLALPELDFSFRDYVLAEQRRRESEAYRRAQSYWMDRIERLPAAPDLPLRPDVSARRAPRFNRRDKTFDKERWSRLKATAQAKGLTPSGLLLALFSELLVRWSATPHFTLNLTLGDRQPWHRDVPSLMGDFTTVLLLEVDRRDPTLSFREFALQLQHQFLEDLGHAQFSGVAVAREWAKRRGMSRQAVMPVVFTSGLIKSDYVMLGNSEEFGREVLSCSQTPQVWLDHHVLEEKGELYLSWDAADAVFEEGVLDAMFASYCSLIEELTGELTDGESLWDRHLIVTMPKAMRQRREEANRTAAALPDGPLHAGFVTRALAYPDDVAVVAAGRTIAYGELLAESVVVADWLLENGLRPAQPVAVLMHKGWEQIVAVYGVLLAGGAYVPVDADLPTKRQQELLRLSEAAHVLTQPNVLRDEVVGGGWALHEIRAGARGEYGPIHAKSLQVGLDQLAYVIFTSGTTGVPKGVMIDHRGASNTVEHINRLFDVGPHDRVLGVSSLSFDLSVYDIFGLHAAGGALVLPDYARRLDAAHWRELLIRHRVTLWNSAPQLMRMLMDRFFGGERESASLRAVMLSGDFIPLDLPSEVRVRYPETTIVSLGGATEASIWSVYYPVESVDPSWSSIPYGKPLPNQTIWVLDDALRPTPDHVRGRIHIGGAGLAMGYWRDPEKTAARFITHPVTGERLYDTGDLGRYAPDGNIVILGRDDGQVKIRGHRVELGEIEAVLRQHPRIKHAVVLTKGPSESRQPIAYVELSATDAGQAAPLDVQAVKDYLGERLPDYMIPRTVVQMDRIPVSANGKIDYGALPDVSEAETEQRVDIVWPRNDIERSIHDVWARVMPDVQIGVTDNFFELGGDSLVAAQLIREVNAALQIKFEVYELFEHLTIEALATLYQHRAASDVETPSADTTDDETLFADIRAAKEYFDTLEFSSAQATFGTQPRGALVTGATGWIGIHVLSELLSRTAATLYCLTRTRDNAHSRRQIFEKMRQYGIEIAPSWVDRLVPVYGDLSAPELALNPADWQKLLEAVDSIYHLGADVALLRDYSVARKANVSPLTALVQLAVEHHTKPVFFLSPLVVSRRRLQDRLVVSPEERVHADPQGLLAPYAQSKWVAEHVLLAAMERGLPVKIFRTSRALPSSRTGLAKAKDTYGTVLEVARRAGVIPEWVDSSMYGVPVDLLARLIVECSLIVDDYRGVIHIEHRTPSSLESIVAALLEAEQGGREKPRRVSLEEWKARCLQAADTLPDEFAALAAFSFTRGPFGTPVENMFSRYPYDTKYLEQRGMASRISDLTPAAYWRQVRPQLEW